MSLIDTHTHLYMPEFDADGGGAKAVERAIAAGVDMMIFPNVDASTVQPMKALAAQYPDHVRMAMGLHPTEVRDDWREQCEHLMQELDCANYVAIGEVGIDLYWDKTYAEQQQLAFDRQLVEAEKRQLPVIIHCREGLDPILEILKGHPDVRAVFHSFGGSEQDVERIRQVGDYYFGINGIVTFKNSKLRDVLPAIGIDRILLETDAPYLSPVPHRGKRNESAYMVNTAAFVAQSLSLTNDAVAQLTTNNTKQLFNI